MSFSPDRTANLPPRTCPSSNNHLRHRLQLPLGAVHLAVGDATFNDSDVPKEAEGSICRLAFDNMKYNEQ